MSLILDKAWNCLKSNILLHFERIDGCQGIGDSASAQYQTVVGESTVHVGIFLSCSADHRSQWDMFGNPGKI